ncbi:two-component system, response regulator FlrC [Desulfatibacillum alkenivorans DSM 16219]|jgi:two-component system response regulator FlrC|uniref:Two-component system, response regulator FlrC n=1 Tax=Desulfatibacillum alkenivorans DSM 16219 TaxID=1121393 RepID=A0A1M6V393_9BACT|nr:sigma-54 dependent transcriptional regulator [Desulfatibacillum alkenivorans]SHK75776.1 two-component system, response regulator FlrC [Desulfatibacillum alkenivorans DSM 16219]
MEKDSILLVEHEYQDRLAWSDFLENRGYHIQAVGDGALALERLKSQEYKLIIANDQAPGLSGSDIVRKMDGKVPVILVSSDASVDQAVEAMKSGARDFLLKPVSAQILGAVVGRALGVSKSNGTPRAGGKSPVKIITQDDRMKRCLEVVDSVADSKAAVLISGESGTGKELFARQIHYSSSRKDKNFVAVNVAALPETLLESELFGHEKGAFTGAINRKIGKFELANGGTLLLDEITEMDIGLQAKLLRVLQESEVDRVGGTSPVNVDVRVVATTNRDVEQAIADGKFRSDLYYRLAVIPLKLPPLRERSSDVILLAEHFIRKYNARDGKNVKGLTKNAQNTLLNLDWPGNVRELENTIERAVLLCKGDHIDHNDLFMEPPPPKALPRQDSIPSVSTTLREMEEQMIYQALDQTEGNRTHAAQILGISVRTLRNKLNEYQAKA